MSKLILFDVDGTLVLTGGAGARAMTRAFHEVYGVDRAFARVAMPGRTDDLILADALAGASLDHDAGRIAAFRARYLEDLAEELQTPHPDKRVMPGIVPLLDALARRPDVFLSLLTGNFPEAARAKLEHFELWRYFRAGAFGGDAPGRNALVAVAVARAEAAGLRLAGPRDVFIVGDTPLDIACARSAGAVSIGVATGGSAAVTLAEAGADAVFEDLTETGAFMRVLDGEFDRRR